MSGRAALRERRSRQQRQRQLVYALIVIGAALVVGALILIPNLRSADIVLPPPRERPMTDGTAMGNPEAPVVIEEYSDFQCPFCARFSSETEPQLAAEFISSGQVYFVYRNFAFIVSTSKTAAEASLCAAEQDAFWPYHDLLFANQDETDPASFSDRRLEVFAETLELDMQAFKECLRERRYRDEVQRDLEAGRDAGVASTPSFLINGKLVVGAQPIEVFRQEIEAALATSSP